jgi:hypothetical protein
VDSSASASSATSAVGAHAAIRIARTRPLGDAWAWSRKNSTGNISPLVSATLALSAAVEHDSNTGGIEWWEPDEDEPDEPAEPVLNQFGQPVAGVAA